jgi:hypothetical protein
MSLSEREQVAMALNPRQMGPVLHNEFREQFQTQPHPRLSMAPVTCYIEDVKYEPGDYCQVLYRVNDQYIIGSFDWGTNEDTDQPAVKFIQPPGMQAYLFPNDPALPGLAVALDPMRVAEALSQALPDLHPSRARILRCQVTVLRFRPGKRCTVRLDLRLCDKITGRICKKTYFGKIYHRMDKARAAFQEMQLLSSALPSRQGQVVFADAPGWLPDLLMVLQSPVSGTPMDLYLDCATASAPPQIAAGMRQAASALACVHTAGLVAGRERPIEKELSRFIKRAGKIARIQPDLGQEIENLARGLAEWHPHLEEWGAANTLVHGDCKPSQFLLREDGAVAILDFDHCGMADPASDVGNFLATLQQFMVQHTYKHREPSPPCARWVPDLKRQFLSVYLQTSQFSEGFRQRAAWYEVVALLRKAIRAFERSPYSPIPGLLVAEGGQVLEQVR